MSGHWCGNHHVAVDVVPSTSGAAPLRRFAFSSELRYMLLYSLLHLTGFADVTMENLMSFRQCGPMIIGHPENFEPRCVWG